MKLEDPRKQTEDLYSDQQLQMRPLLDVMINRSVWEEVTARVPRGEAIVSHSAHSSRLWTSAGSAGRVRLARPPSPGPPSETDPLFGPRAQDGRRSGAPTGALGRWGRGAVPCRGGTRGAAAVGADARRGGRGAIKAAAAAAGRQHHGELPGAGAVRRGGRAAAERPRARIDPAAPRPRPGTARRRRRLPGEGADRGAAGGAGEAQEQEGTALREEVRAGAHVRRRGAVRREEGGSHREALRLPPGDVVQFLPPQVPVSRGVPGQAAGSAGTDVWPPGPPATSRSSSARETRAKSPRRRVTLSVTSDIRGAVFFLSPAPPRPLPRLLPCFFLSVQENPGPCLGSRGAGPGSCSAVPLQTRVVPSRAGKPYWPRAVPRGVGLLPREENIHPLPAGGAGARGLP